jgi:hypothetical protein
LVFFSVCFDDIEGVNASKHLKFRALHFKNKAFFGAEKGSKNEKQISVCDNQISILKADF